MDELFKHHYVSYAFSLLPKIHPQWEIQLENLHLYWEQVLALIEKNQFSRMFTKECEELHLPAAEYNLEDAFGKVNNEWRTELMLAVANKILRWYEDDIPEEANILIMEKGCIQMDAMQCLQYGVPFKLCMNM